MIRKILLLSLLICPISQAKAQADKYCIPSAKLTQMRDQMPSLNQDMQRAYNELFYILLKNNESGDIANAGCVTQQDLAQICKNVWDDNTEMCETFIYNIMDTPAGDVQPLPYLDYLAQTDFSTIDPDVFNQAVNKAVARRKRKNVPSKLQNMGSVFLDQAKEKQINPFISTAIALYESDRGTSNIARTRNNIAGLGGPGKWLTFATVPDSIAKQAATLQNKIANGKTDLRTLACSGSYCSTNTTPWFKNVSSIAKELYRHYNAILQGQK